MGIKNETKKMTKNRHQLISKLLQKQTYTDNQTVMIAGEVECVVVKEGMVYQVTHFLSSGIYTLHRYFRFLPVLKTTNILIFPLLG